MKAAPECIVCMYRQALNTARRVTDDERLQARVLAKIGETPFELNQTPAALSKPAYTSVNSVLGVTDPYRDDKKATNEAALRILPSIRKMIAGSGDPLDAALHAAVAGNIIDMGIGSPFELETDIHRIMGEPFAINHLEKFRSELRASSRILYLGDNAGEIILDTLLVEHMISLGKEVTFSVKSGPIINDATMEDAVTAGLPSIARVIETGSDDIGVHWDHVSSEFADAFASADLIISKGHGNFETCTGRPGNIFFLLKAKCSLVAAELGVPLGSIVLSHQGTR